MNASAVVAFAARMPARRAPAPSGGKAHCSQHAAGDEGRAATIRPGAFSPGAQVTSNSQHSAPSLPQAT